MVWRAVESICHPAIGHEAHAHAPAGRPPASSAASVPAGRKAPWGRRFRLPVLSRIFGRVCAGWAEGPVGQAVPPACALPHLRSPLCRLGRCRAGSARWRPPAHQPRRSRAFDSPASPDPAPNNPRRKTWAVWGRRFRPGCQSALDRVAAPAASVRDRAARDPRAGVAGWIGFVIVFDGVDHQRGTAFLEERVRL